MFLRTTTRKNADGTRITYLQLAESAWNKRTKRSETRIIHSFGRVDSPEMTDKLRRLAQSILKRCSPEELVEGKADWRLLDAWPYGHVYALEALWKRLQLDQTIAQLSDDRKFEFSLERALFSMVANRCIAPCSKLYCYEQWLQNDVWVEETKDLQLHHLYRAMDFLIAQKEEIEKALFFRLGDLFSLDVEVIFYDTTSLHFEIDQEDSYETSDEVSDEQAEQAESSEHSSSEETPPLRKRGYSKNKRNEVPQIVVGLAVTRDGFPIKHWVFPGNTVDVSTVEQVKEDLKGWRLTRCVFVADAGIVSQENLRLLSMGGGKYIVCMPAKQGSEVSKEVLTRKGRYQTVAENLRVKEVIVGEGERRRRYAVCHNPQEEERQRKHRAQVLREIEAELASLQENQDGSHSKKVCQLLSSRRYGRYLRQTKKGKLKIDKGSVRAAEKMDGKFVVHSNDDSLSAEDMALGYKQLMRVEECWRTLKSGLSMRPVYHSLEHRIRAHVMLAVLGLLLERIAEQACEDTWRNIRDDLKQIKVAQLLGPDGELWQVTEPGVSARKRLQSLEIKNPPTVLDFC